MLPEVIESIERLFRRVLSTPATVRDVLERAVAVARILGSIPVACLQPCLVFKCDLMLSYLVV